MTLAFTYRGSRELPEVSTKRQIPRLRRQIIQGDRKLRRSLLEDIANVDRWTMRAFWKRWKPYYEFIETNQDVISVRDQLRKTWSRPMSADAAIVLRSLFEWVRPANGWFAERFLLMPDLGLVAPNLANMRLSVAVAFVENARNLRKCHNPRCSTPYFLSCRKNQYCEEPKCQEEGQKAHKRKYAHERRAAVRRANKG